MIRSRLLAAAGLVACGAAIASTGSAQVADRPRLVVVLVVDQMRQDYVDRMASRWTRGLKRLITDGAVFERNRYPYLQTVTCPGHATIATGSFPARHGIILNAWWRGTRNAPCTEDPAVRAIGYEPGADPRGHSAVQLLVPTLGDRLRAASPASRVVTLSLKARSAIMLAGQGGVVTWLDERKAWATSTAYAETPDADVQAFIRGHPRQTSPNQVWDRLMDANEYTGVDAGLGERPPRGWTATFPHPLTGAEGTNPADEETLWETSPFSDTYLGALAADLVARKALGQRTAVDYLGIGFSALDLVGHKFGPDSHEVQDTLLRLDLTIGDLLDALDRHVGRGRYLVGLSADHGVAPVPEARTSTGGEAGRMTTRELTQAATAALGSVLGPGVHLARAEYTQVYLTDAAQARLRAEPDLSARVAAALGRLPGVERARASEGLERERQSADPAIRAAALSFRPERSGQFILIPRPYHVTTGDATTHGTHHDYDQQVPLIFFGAGVKPGRHRTPTTPADLAPTLASRIGLDWPGVDGTVQRAAFNR